MPLDAARKIESLSAATPYGADNDDVKGKGNPLVRQAAQTLIDKGAITLKAFGVPHEALEQISLQLEQLGMQQQIADELIEALKDDIVSKGGTFARAANAKPLSILLSVSDKKPQPLYDTGALEITAIDGFGTTTISNVSYIERQLTASGSKSSSQRADLMKDLQKMNGAKVWCLYEAPDQEELKGIEAQQTAAIEAIAVAVAEASTPEQLDAIIEQVQEAGLPPETMNMVANLVELKNLAEAPATPETQARMESLSVQIVEQLSAITDTAIPAAIAHSVHAELAAVVEAQGLEQVVPVEALESAQTQIVLQDTIQQLESISSTLEDAPRAEMKALIESLKEADGAALLQVIEDVQQFVIENNLQDQVAIQSPALQETMAALTSAVEADIVRQEAAQTKMAQDIVAVIQSLNEADTLPPEIQAILEKIDPAAVTVDAVKEALSTPAPEVNSSAESINAAPSQETTIDAASLKELVAAITHPDIQAVLPPAVSGNATIVAMTASVPVMTTPVQGVSPETVSKIDTTAARVSPIAVLTQAALTGTTPLVPPAVTRAIKTAASNYNTAPAAQRRPQSASQPARAMARPAATPAKPASDTKKAAQTAARKAETRTPVKQTTLEGAKPSLFKKIMAVVKGGNIDVSKGTKVAAPAVPSPPRDQKFVAPAKGGLKNNTPEKSAATSYTVLNQQQKFSISKAIEALNDSRDIPARDKLALMKTLDKALETGTLDEKQVREIEKVIRQNPELVSAFPKEVRDVIKEHVKDFKADDRYTPPEPPPEDDIVFSNCDGCNGTKGCPSCPTEDFEKVSKGLDASTADIDAYFETGNNPSQPRPGLS